VVADACPYSTESTLASMSSGSGSGWPVSPIAVRTGNGSPLFASEEASWGVGITIGVVAAALMLALLFACLLRAQRQWEAAQPSVADPVSPTSPSGSPNILSVTEICVGTGAELDGLAATSCAGSPTTATETTGGSAGRSSRSSGGASAAFHEVAPVTVSTTAAVGSGARNHHHSHITTVVVAGVPPAAGDDDDCGADSIPDDASENEYDWAVVDENLR
jgi:hypothetical protein